MGTGSATTEIVDAELIEEVEGYPVELKNGAETIMSVPTNAQGTFDFDHDESELYKNAGDFMHLHNRDLVVVPSLSLSPYELANYTSVTFLEERSLFYLLLLQNPTIRLTFVTSRSFDDAILNYYISIMEATGAKDLRSRVKMINLQDISQKTLACKVLARPHIMEDIKRTVRPGRGGFICVQSNYDEQKLADEVGTKYLANNPDLEKWGTKHGARALFAEAGIPHANGTPIMRSIDKLAGEIVKIYMEDNTFTKIMVKLDTSFNGEGNAILDLAPLNGDISVQTVKKQFAKMKFSKSTETWESYGSKICSIGAIAERFLANEISTPSFIGYISEGGEVHRLGTQEQVLDGLEYMGCIFPVSDAYRLVVQENGYKVGQELARKGARGHFGIDFMVCGNNETNAMDVFAVEINLRHTGSTYPFMFAKLLTNAVLEADTGMLKSSKGTNKHYQSFSYVKHQLYKHLTPATVLSILEGKGLLFNVDTQTGVAFQMLGSVTEFGKFGMTCIGDSREQVVQLSNDVLSALADACAALQQ